MNENVVSTWNQPFERTENLIPVLLVEDDRIIQKVMALLLTRLNCRVEVAPNAETALALANENIYELIFLDIGLPDASGNEVALKIRNDENCQNQLTPIVAVTAHLDGRGKKACHLAGINIVISKPMSEATARDVIKLFLQS